MEIVGVVGDVKYESIDQPVNADFYTSYLCSQWECAPIPTKSQMARARAAVIIEQVTANASCSRLAFGHWNLTTQMKSPNAAI